MCTHRERKDLQAQLVVMASRAPSAFQDLLDLRDPQERMETRSVCPAIHCPACICDSPARHWTKKKKNSWHF